jgi:hypothetical protein
MLPPPKQPPGRAPARGQITWVGLLLLALLAGGAYLAWTWVPVYLVRFQVRQTVKEYMNRAVKDRNDDQLKSDLSRTLAALHDQTWLDQAGRPYEAPLVNVEPHAIVWERSEGPPPMLHVRVEYVHWVRYPFLQRVVQHPVVVEDDNDLTPPVWGASN